MSLLRRLWFLLTKRQREDELAEELEFHRQMKADELRVNGQAAQDLDTSVQRALGNDLLARERSRDVWIAPWLQDITQDIRFGARMLAKDRRFTIAAVIALTLGIGINSAVFTLANTALFKPLPFDEPARLVDARLVSQTMRGDGGVSYADFVDWSRMTSSFEGLFADQGGTMNVSEEGRPAERLRGAYVTGNAFRVLRVAPFLGRDFTAGDDSIGASGVVIISYAVWQSRYGGEPSAIGRTIRINSTPATIVGVMPQGFGFPLTAQLWQPLSSAPNLNVTNRSILSLSVVGRLAPGVDLSRARVDLQTVIDQLAQAHPGTNKNLRLELTTLHDSYNGPQAWIALGTLMGAVTFVLLIACANVASLLLARSAQRSREIAIRSSLGASRWRIVRQLLIECMLIAGIAGIGGLSLSRYVSSVMSSAFEAREIGAPGEGFKPYWVDLSVDAVTLMFLGGLLLIVSVGVGLMPSWHLSKTNANDVLKDGGRAGGATVRARRMTGGLLVGQLALTLILLSGAGLLMRAYFTMYLADLVVDTTGVVTMRVVLPVPKYAGVARQRQFIRELDQRLVALPMFRSVALGSDIPLHPLGFGSRSLAIYGRTWDADQPPDVFFVTVGPRYFETLGLSVLQGRMLTPFDSVAGQEGALVNQRLASKYFPNGDAIGKRIRLTGQNFNPEQAPWFTIVGISPPLPNFFPDRSDEPMAYVPFDADPGPQRAVSIIVRAADPRAGKAAAAAALREEVSAMDADLPVFGVQTLDEAVDWARGPNRMLGSWFLTIALVALLLASVGLYALTAHGVVQRAHEIGVRMALGAQSREVVWLFVRRTVIQLALGLTLGAAGALAVGRLLSMFLRGTNPRDPLALTIAAAVLVVVSLTASVWPARRAARIDPAVVLRSD